MVSGRPAYPRAATRTLASAFPPAPMGSSQPKFGSLELGNVGRPATQSEVRMRRQPEAFDDVDDRGRGKRLFHIEPEGGFSHPESLHSWVVNLARAHSLSPIVLLKYLIAQS